jgi:hypothetical protein
MLHWGIEIPEGAPKISNILDLFLPRFVLDFLWTKHIFLSAKQNSKHYVTEFHIFVFLLVFFCNIISLFWLLIYVLCYLLKNTCPETYAWHLDWQHLYCLFFSTGEHGCTCTAEYMFNPCSNFFKTSLTVIPWTLAKKWLKSNLSEMSAFRQCPWKMAEKLSILTPWW